MRELLLLRHAKSAWDQPGRDDHERDLAPRGIQAAQAMGELIRREQLQPELVLCSTATRARRTLELAAAAWSDPPPVRHLRTLYLAAPGRMIEIVRRQAAGVGRLMLVGHNPGMGTLALRLLRERAGREAELLGEKFPTGAIAQIAFAAEGWGGIGEASGTLLAFHRPRDLD